jgi:anti-anti-sigma regulatory factor
MGIEMQPITESLSEGSVLMRLSGIVSLRDVTELKSSLKRLLRGKIRNLLLDFEGLQDMDEACWAVLVSTVRKIRKSEGQAAIRNCPDKLYQHLQARRWDRDFLFPLRFAEHLSAIPKDLRALFVKASFPRST